MLPASDAQIITLPSHKGKLCILLTFTTLWANSAEDSLIFSSFRNQALPNPIFWENMKTIIFQNVVCCYSSILNVNNTMYDSIPKNSKTYKKTSATSEDSDQPAHPRSLIRVFADRMCLLQPPGYPKKDKREPLVYCVDVQTDLSICWPHRSYCRFCRALKIHRKRHSHKSTPLSRDQRRNEKQTMAKCKVDTQSIINSMGFNIYHYLGKFSRRKFMI